MMKRHYITHLEAQLEQLIEGTFAGLFGKRIQAHDVALRLARAMEDGLHTAQPDEEVFVAPDRYIIYLHPEIQTYLQNRHSELAQTLAAHLTELALQAGYRLNQAPQVYFKADHRFSTGELTVIAEHTAVITGSTIAMQPVTPTIDEPHPNNARLVIDNNHAMPLNERVINIGRHLDNDIVIDDPHASRVHVQLQLREGAYVLFDVQSLGGTRVNGIETEKHRLQPGDVIQIGQTRLLYLDDNQASGIEYTQPFNPDSL